MGLTLTCGPVTLALDLLSLAGLMEGINAEMFWTFTWASVKGPVQILSAMLHQLPSKDKKGRLVCYTIWNIKLREMPKETSNFSSQCTWLRPSVTVRRESCLLVQKCLLNFDSKASAWLLHHQCSWAWTEWKPCDFIWKEFWTRKQWTRVLIFSPT